MTKKPNTTERLRQLLLEIYVSGSLNLEEAIEAERIRLLDIVIDAAEGREFADLGLPFPRDAAPAAPGPVTLPALPEGWVYVAQPKTEAWP